MAQLERLRESVDRICVADPAERKAMADLEAARLRLAGLRGSLEGIPIDEVHEIDRRMFTSNDWVGSMETVVTSSLRRVEKRLARVAEMKRTMAALSDEAGRTSAPPGILLRISNGVALLDDLERRLIARRAEVLVAIDKLAEVRGNGAALGAEAEARLDAARRAVDRYSREPIWRIRLVGWSALEGGAARLRRDVVRAWVFVGENAPLFLLVLALVFGATAVLLARLRREAPSGAGTAPPASGGERIVHLSWVAAIPVAVVALCVAAPPAPPAFYALALVPAAPAAAWIVVKLLGPGMGRTVWVLAASLVLLPLQGALELFPLVGRCAFLLQTVPLAALLVLDFRKAHWKERIPNERFAFALQRVAWLLAALLAISAAATVGGWLQVATLLGVGSLWTLAGIVITASTYLVLVETFRAVLSSGSARWLLVVRNQREKVERAGLKALRFFAVGTGSLVALDSFQLLQPAIRLLSSAFRGSVSLGSMSISVGGIFSFLLVLGSALLLSRLVSFLLAEEILPRLSLGRGTAFAVTTSTQYLLLLAGFSLAAGAAGVDLSKVGFLAGALGVGIGFGLQNIVSNFISGLILIFERPIQVGDTVDVSGTVGSVRHIGIRASTIRTLEGAEVIVPNADLISKPLVNWTLSDPHRRFDVVVGVAYGSPLEVTAQALLAAAGRTRGVLRAPSPEAFFQTFGASSLDWALRVWVGIDESARVLSSLKRAVSEELERAGIEVPFPQQEIRIRSVAPEAREALRGTREPSGPA